MNFLAPLSFALLALIPPIIALYFLKLRRQDYPVSSIYLWQRFVRDVEANAPWQRLRRNLLLLLQLLFMLALIVALARPATATDEVSGQTVVLILDTSASMMTLDGEAGLGGNPTSRLEAAQTVVRDLLANLPDDSRVTLITAAGGEANLRVSSSQNQRQVLNALAEVQPTTLGSDLGPALSLAEAIIAQETQAEIVLFSDGAVQLPENLTAIRFVPVGQSGGNQAISNLSVTPLESGEAALFVQLRNYDQQDRQRRLIIDVNGSPFTALDLTLPAGDVLSIGAQQTSLILPPDANTVAARLDEAAEDPFSLDDQLQIVVRPNNPVRTTLVTEGNFFLQTALNLLNTRAVGPSLDLTLTTFEDWQTNADEAADDEEAEGATFHIFDKSVPDILPAGNLLFIAPPESVPGLFEVLGAAQAPIPRTLLTDHPLLANVNLNDVQISEMGALNPEGWARTVVEADVGEGQTLPLLLVGESDGRRIVVLAFDLQQSDLPLRPAFPIWTANLVRYLAPDAAGLIPTQLSTGESLPVVLPPEADQVRLVTPDGQATVFEREDNVLALPAFSLPGLYRLDFERGGLTREVIASAPFAVNFSDPIESDITPRPTLPVIEAAAGGAAQTALAQREWWRPLAVAALLFLILEWLVANRNRFFKLQTAIWQRMGRQT